MTTKTKTEKALSKSEITAALSESTGLTKAQVNRLFESLASLVGKNIGNGGPGIFTLPGLLKIKVSASRPPRPAPASTRSPSKRRPSRPSRPATSSSCKP